MCNLVSKINSIFKVTLKCYDSYVYVKKAEKETSNEQMRSQIWNAPK